MNQKKDLDDANLFLFFVKKLRECPEECGSKLLKSFTMDQESYSQDDKYKCIYCGCEYVYRRSLISHLKRLHNIKNID